MTLDETRSPDLPVPLISVRGTPTECGAGYGAAAAATIGANLELYRRRFRDQAGLDTAAVRTAGDRFRTVTLALHPRIAAMLDGVADGAGVDVAEVYALNARTELLYDTRTLVQRRHASSAVAPDGPGGGCTAAGVLGTHTADGHLLIGQNWDWHPDQRHAMVLLATHDERGHGVLTLTEAGMLAKAGLNSAGVGVCVNMLGSDRDGLPPGDGSDGSGPGGGLGNGGSGFGGAGGPGGDGPGGDGPGGDVPGGGPGVPYHVLLRSVLEADSLSWALRTACRTPRNASINLLIGQAGDPAHGDPASGGELIDLELVPGDAGWLHPVDGMITHANHLESGINVRDTVKDWGGSSPFRSARARRLLAGPAAAGTVTEKDLAAMLRDHASFPLAICRHVDERDAPVDRTESVYSVLLDLDARRFGLAPGPPCRHEYAWLSLPALAPLVQDRHNS
ncbi:MAG TPA: C45 family peptidase [Pilimelia sp.]|nr:C45 family peptidase [Pilimelia sp.]